MAARRKGSNNTKSAAAAKPQDERLELIFPYEIVRWTRSEARRTGTTEIRTKVDPADLIVTGNRAKLRDGAEVEVSGYKRDGKTRAMRSKHTAHYTKPLAATADDDD